MTFGQRVRELRKARNTSQRELADRVAAKLRDEDRRGFDVTYLSKLENDRLPPPSAAAVLALAAALDADADELMVLARKPPAGIGEALQSSAGARVFFRSAVSQQLSEEQWRQLIEKLRELGNEDT